MNVHTIEMCSFVHREHVLPAHLPAESTCYGTRNTHTTHTQHTHTHAKGTHTTHIPNTHTHTPTHVFYIDGREHQLKIHMPARARAHTHTHINIYIDKYINVY